MAASIWLSALFSRTLEDSDVISELTYAARGSISPGGPDQAISGDDSSEDPSATDEAELDQGPRVINAPPDRRSNRQSARHCTGHIRPGWATGRAPSINCFRDQTYASAQPITHLWLTPCIGAGLQFFVQTDIVFITTNLRELVQPERTDPAGMLAATPGSLGRVPSQWLACYPMFRDALQRSETSFRKLPRHVKLVALKRTTVDAAEQAIALTILDDVGASFVELSTGLVEDAVECYFAMQTDGGISHTMRDNTLLDELAEQITGINQSHAARPPCVLRPGQGIFLDGWMRFFSYRARGDKTIPLLAIDWTNFHERLCSLYPGSVVA